VFSLIAVFPKPVHAANDESLFCITGFMQRMLRRRPRTGFVPVFYKNECIIASEKRVFNWGYAQSIRLQSAETVKYLGASQEECIHIGINTGALQEAGIATGRGRKNTHRKYL